MLRPTTYEYKGLCNKLVRGHMNSHEFSHLPVTKIPIVSDTEEVVVANKPAFVIWSTRITSKPVATSVARQCS